MTKSIKNPIDIDGKSYYLYDARKYGADETRLKLSAAAQRIYGRQNLYRILEIDYVLFGEDDEEIIDCVRRYVIQDISDKNYYGYPTARLFSEEELNGYFRGWQNEAEAANGE